MKQDGSGTKFNSPAKIPVALAICRESRQEALTFYEFAFGVDSLPGEICFDFSIDSILLDCEILDYEGARFEFLEIASGFNKLRSLICCYYFSTCFGSDEYADEAAAAMPSLERFACLNNHVGNLDQRDLCFQEELAVDELEDGEDSRIQSVLGATFTYGEIEDHNPVPDGVVDW